MPFPSSVNSIPCFLLLLLLLRRQHNNPLWGNGHSPIGGEGTKRRRRRGILLPVGWEITNNIKFSNLASEILVRNLDNCKVLVFGQKPYYDAEFRPSSDSSHVSPFSSPPPLPCPKKNPPPLRMVGWTLGEGWFCRMGKREGGRCLKCALNPLPFLLVDHSFSVLRPCVLYLNCRRRGEGPSRNRNPPRYFPSSSSLVARIIVSSD